ncbi:MAG TPA: HEAT repeat domain-containing protein [Polyangia bacterium]|nr:HEAT repeat domain-containing protein [Polyangia bacterium]
MRARTTASRLAALVAVLCGGAARGADAVPTADGGLDVRAGGAVVAHVPLSTPALRRGPAAVREVEVDGHRLIEVRVPNRGSARVEAWVGEVGGRVVWSGFVGPRDADGETGLALDVTADGVVESQTAAVVSRCDGAPARLFPRAYDFDAGQFRPVVSPLPPAAGATLTARRGDPAMPAGRPVAPFSFTAASTTRAAGTDARALAAPTAVDDGDPATSWAEGLGGDGRGEWLTARAGAGGLAVRGLRFIPGDAASAATFRARNRVRRIQLALGPRADQRFDVVVPEDPAADAAKFREPYWVALPRPVVASCATVILTEVTPGTEASPPKSFGTTAIAELTIFTDLDGPDAAARLVGEIAHAPDCATRVPALVALGAAAEPSLVKAIGAATPGAPRECLVDALARIDSLARGEGAAGAFVSALSGASEKEERVAAAALRASPTPPVAALAATLGAANGPVADRVRAARVLGQLGTNDAAAALLAAVGAGSAEMRQAVLAALAESPRLAAAPIFAAIGATSDAEPGREADLARLLPAVVRRDSAAAPRALEVLRADVAPGRPFEVRARATVALAGLGEAGLVMLIDVARHADEPVLRHLAARELGGLAGTGSDAAAQALRAALADGDPRVRETAADALARRRDAGAAAELAAGAKQEPWPFVRRAEVEALGAICPADAGDLFVRALERDVDEVKRAALLGLARCRDARAREALIHTVGRRNESASLRSLAASLLGETGDRAVAAPLAAALDRQVSESEEDLSIEGVATSTLRALVRLGGPDATRAAVNLATDTRHPFRRTAVEALGQLCDPGAGAATLRAIEAGSDASLATAAQSASRRCSVR